MRYSAPTVVLHWLAAALLAVQLPLGLSMDEENAAGVAHAMIGLSILGVTLLRIGARVATPAPALLEGVSPIERWGAKAAHLALYALLIATPLSGIAAWRADRADEPIPIIGALTANPPASAPDANLIRVSSEEVEPPSPAIGRSAPDDHATFEGHGALAFALLALVCLHVLAVTKHFVVDGANLIARMSLGRGA